MICFWYSSPGKYQDVEEELRLIYKHRLRLLPLGEFDREAGAATCSIPIVERPIDDRVGVALRRLAGGGSWG